MTSLEYFRLFAPEFSGMSDSDVVLWIMVATSIITTGGLDDERASMAVAYYAAHLCKSSADTGGNVVSEKEGDLSRTYANTGTIESTGYGRQYLEIMRAAYGASIMTRGAYAGC